MTPSGTVDALIVGFGAAEIASHNAGAAAVIAAHNAGAAAVIAAHNAGAAAVIAAHNAGAAAVIAAHNAGAAAVIAAHNAGAEVAIVERTGPDRTGAGAGLMSSTADHSMHTLRFDERRGAQGQRGDLAGTHLAHGLGVCTEMMVTGAGRRPDRRAPAVDDRRGIEGGCPSTFGG